MVDPRTIKPLDEQLIVESVSKTGRVVIADGGWRSYGVAAEITAVIGENCLLTLKSNIKRVTLPDVPAPASRSLEAVYYPRSADIVEAIKSLF